MSKTLPTPQKERKNTSGILFNRSRNECKFYQENDPKCRLKFTWKLPENNKVNVFLQLASQNPDLSPADDL